MIVQTRELRICCQTLGCGVPSGAAPLTAPLGLIFRSKPIQMTICSCTCWQPFHTTYLVYRLPYGHEATRAGQSKVPPSAQEASRKASPKSSPESSSEGTRPNTQVQGVSPLQLVPVGHQIGLFGSFSLVCTPLLWEKAPNRGALDRMEGTRPQETHKMAGKYPYGVCLYSLLSPGFIIFPIFTGAYLGINCQTPG